MSQVTNQGILEVKIGNLLTLQEFIVCVAEFWITCVEKWPIGRSEVSFPQELSTVVSAMMGGRLRQSATLLVLPFLYLMFK